MFPSYQVPPEDIVEVVFAISELGEDASKEQISEFTGESTRKVRESIKVLRELNIIASEQNVGLAIRYDSLIQQLSPDERGAIIEEALVSHQPFVDYASYIDQGYTSKQAAQKVHSAYDVAKSREYLQKYFERLGEFSDVLSEDGNLAVEIREIPANSTVSIEQLRDALDSKLEIRVYLDEILGDEIMNFVDKDTKKDLTDAYLKHASDPRASISAVGRAFEDFLRNVGDTFGSDSRDYSTGSGIIPVGNHLEGDNLIKKIHKRRIFAFAELRNKGGAHGDDAEQLERWKTSPEVSLSQAIEATLLIRSIYRYASEGELVL